MTAQKDGSKRIADIKVGDEVYSENPETGETGYQKVVQVFVVKTNTILTIKTQNETIETTKPHPFYVIGKGFVAAKDLQVGDHLKMANGEEAVIESLTLTHHDKPITVYNFEVENWHTYHVSGSEVLVHNVAKNPCGVGGDASDAIHGNSKLNTKAQHGYEIFDKETGDVVKTGISGQTLNKNGTSPRANSQVNAWNRNAGFDKFDSRIMQTDMPGRQSALDWEMNNAMKLKGEGNSMSRHKRPTPWEE